MSRFLQTSCLLLLVSSSLNSAFAHYLWLHGIPADPDTQVIFNIDIRMGDDLPGEPLANDLSQYELFDVYRNGQSEYVSGERGRLPSGYIEDDGNPFAVYYRSVNRSLVMQQSDFLRHLVVEGLRQQFEQYDSAGRPPEIEESYTHHAMLLVDEAVPPTDNPEIRKAFMLSPDFVVNPENENSSARFHLTFEGNPVADAPVTLRCADQSQPVTRLYTSNKGQVSFKQLCKGSSLLHTIYLKASNDSATQWESHWLSLTLHRR